MNPEIKDFYFTEPVKNIDGPPYYLELEIGVPGHKGADLFFLEIRQIETFSLEKKNISFLKKGVVIMNNVDIKEVIEFIKDYLQKIEASSWDELAKKISLMLPWEFDDYIPG